MCFRVTAKKGLPFPRQVDISFVDHRTKCVPQGNGRRRKCIRMTWEEAKAKWTLPTKFECRIAHCAKCKKAVASSQAINCLDNDGLAVMIPDYMDIYKRLENGIRRNHAVLNYDGCLAPTTFLPPSPDSQSPPEFSLEKQCSHALRDPGEMFFIMGFECPVCALQWLFSC